MLISLRFVEVGWIFEVPFRRSSLHFVPGYVFVKNKKVDL